MGMIEELGTLLQTASVGTLGTSLFLNALPDATTGVAAAVYEYPGMQAMEKFGGSLPAWERPRVQVVVRSTAPPGGSGIASPVNARAKVDLAWRAFIAVTNQRVPTSTGSYYLRIEPLQSPALLERDDRGRVLFSFNAQVHRAVT